MRLAVLAVFLLSPVTVLALGSPLQPAEAPPRCFGRVATIVGTAGDDRLEGTRAADVIVGGKGVDEIYGRGGDDLICGGFGYEVVPDDEVGEIVVGDRIFAGAGNDRVRGGPHVDDITGDDYRGELGTFGAGDDILIGGGGRDNIRAGHGDNIIRGGPRSDHLSSGVGDDVIFCGRGHETDVVAGHGDDRVFGGPGRDVLLPMQGDDVVAGGDGRDLLNLFWEGGRRGVLSSHDRALYVDLRAGSSRGMGNDRLRGIEDVWGGSGDDFIVGDDNANFLGATDEEGEAGNDRNVLKGRGGPDHFIASPGADRIYGGRGFDRIRFALNESGAPGPRTGLIIDLARGTIRGERVDSVSEIEAVHGTGGDDLFIGDEKGNAFRGDYGDDRARGGPGPDRLFGGALRDELDGNRGDDELDGGPGVNRNDGGPGSDVCTRPTASEGATRCEA
jgi:Ca2+-binding RTX toxin-like protein